MHEPDEDELLPNGDPSARTAALRAAVQALTGDACRVCGHRLCGHEAVLAVLLGSRGAPRCAACAAREHAEPAPALCARSLQWIRRRECFHDAWRAASAAEGFGASDEPDCLFAGTRAALPSAAAAAATATSAPPADDRHDAGDLGCGDLVLELKFRLGAMAPGAVLEVRATDPAAPIDLPAWCGLVGHTLLHACHPHYWIRRRERP
ncbi:MAG: sulfurtransferase TusA family protein [Planctomycetes bacterium]|nr:sulfurtransferase TusA family protein [Planctomycetota bacterium]